MVRANCTSTPWYLMSYFLGTAIEEISCRQIPTLIDGEITDVVYEKANIHSIIEDDLITMSRKKTGSIFACAGLIGAMVGLNQCDPEHPHVAALTEFARRSGVAFQLLDDIINIIGTSEQTGKPVGSDIIIGKRTIPLIHSLRHSTGQDNLRLHKTFGNAKANPEEVEEAITIIKRNGGIEYTRDLAFCLISEAFAELDVLPESGYKTLIALLGRRLVDRRV